MNLYHMLEDKGDLGVIRGDRSGMGNMSPAGGYQSSQSVVHSAPGSMSSVDGCFYNDGITSRWVLTVDPAAGHRMRSIGENSGGPSVRLEGAGGPRVPECAGVESY
jgi:hypothetical protein